jgi:hypothetical protein
MKTTKKLLSMIIAIAMVATLATAVSADEEIEIEAISEEIEIEEISGEVGGVETVGTPGEDGDECSDDCEDECCDADRSDLARDDDCGDCEACEEECVCYEGGGLCSDDCNGCDTDELVLTDSCCDDDDCNEGDCAVADANAKAAESNPKSGVALAIIPVVLAGVAVVVLRKRK